MVCAEPLTFVAYGPCGHRDACVECVARLRLVMEDKRCVICQRESDVVFVTRAMGDYTETIPAERFDGLRRRADDGELERDAVLGMFFDDRATCAKILATNRSEKRYAPKPATPSWRHARISIATPSLSANRLNSSPPANSGWLMMTMS